MIKQVSPLLLKHKFLLTKVKQKTKVFRIRKKRLIDARMIQLPKIYHFILLQKMSRVVYFSV